MIKSDSEKLDVREIERDEQICKKYIFTSSEDLLRVPILNHISFTLNANELYEDKFKEKLFNIIVNDTSKYHSAINDDLVKYFSDKESEGN